MSLLEVQDLCTDYSTAEGSIRAVDDVSFSVDEGRNFGLIGESGCGKSTVARSLLRLLDENGSITNGSIKYKGRELTEMSNKEFTQEIRWKEISFIPQQSLNALDPLERIEDQFIELIQQHRDTSRADASERVRELFEMVGLDPDRTTDYPHQFSGGMRQRVMIAMAIVFNPSLIIADEPTTALDILMQEKVFGTFDRIQQEFDVTFLLITHDVAVVNENCNDIGVMYTGRLIESGGVEDVYTAPHHPYTMGLQNAFPSVDATEPVSIPGTPPQNIRQEQCLFASRCPFATDQCWERTPADRKVGEEHHAACHYTDEHEMFREKAANPDTWSQKDDQNIANK